MGHFGHTEVGVVTVAPWLLPLVMLTADGHTTTIRVTVVEVTTSLYALILLKSLISFSTLGISERVSKAETQL